MLRWPGEGPERFVAGLEHVTKRFGSVAALDDVSLFVEEGEVVALLGPNGAGKSTALAMLLGLRRPDQGRASLFGADPRSASSRRRVGTVPQETAFPATLRVRELVDLVRSHYERPLSTDAVLARFELDGLAGRQLGALSAGQRRRVAVGLAFAGTPDLVVLDEPTTGLDAAARRHFRAAVAAHAGSGGTVLLTTHQLDEADALATRVVLVDQGKVVARGAVGALKAAAGLTRVAFRASPGLRLEGAERDGSFVRLLTADAGATIERLVRERVPLRDLEVRPLTLEEALAARRLGR